MTNVVKPTGHRPNAAIIGCNIREDTCGSDFEKVWENHCRSFGNYFYFPECSESQPNLVPAILPVSDFADFDEWENNVKKFQGGNRYRSKKTAIKKGYYSKIFNWNMHTPDIYEINTSKEVRSGGAMRENYLRSIEELGGVPNRLLPVGMPKSPYYWSMRFGVFQPEPGHKQGDIQVDERLVGYISFVRCGDFACYSSILGHGDHLKHGVMVLLHHDVVAWVNEQREEYARGLRYIMYGAVDSGGAGLMQWKKWGGFGGMEMDAYRDVAPIAVDGVLSEIKPPNRPAPAPQVPPRSPAGSNTHQVSRDGGPKRLDAKLNQHNRARSYRELVSTVLDCGLTLVTYEEYRKSNDRGDICLLRHDVDRSLDRAMIIAEIEASVGWRSTYFMLHPGDSGPENYYGKIVDNRIVHHPELFARCRELQNMGHEVGLHNDFVLLSYLTRRSLKDLIIDELAMFSSEGVRIHGSASHGSTFAAEHGLANYEIFKECVSGGREKGRTVRVNDWSCTLHEIAMQEVSLSYEAYFLPRNIDFSDAGGSVQLISSKVRHTNIDFDTDESIATIAKVIKDQPDPRLVILAHPCWWEKA